MKESTYYATPQDGQEILRILESSPAKGQIELLYTRRPDAYASYQTECKDSRVFVSRKDGRMVGTFAKIPRMLYVDGKPRRVAYLCGLKKDSDYKGTVGFSGGFYRELLRGEEEYYFCSVVRENARMHSFLDDNNTWMQMEKITDYTTFIVNPKVRFRPMGTGYVFGRAAREEEPALFAFLEEEGKKKDFFPVISTMDGFAGLRTEDFYLLKKDGRIVATAALWKQTGYKQYVVKRYGRFMKSLRLFNPLLTALGYIRLPKENTIMEFPMLAFFLSRDEDPAYYRTFLAYIHKEIAQKYGMYVIGLPKGHRLYGLYKSKPTIHFDTKLYGIHFGKRKADTEKNHFTIRKETVRPECGLL